MKKIGVLLVFVLMIIGMSSCASSQKGCGLTSDNQVIEQNTTEIN